MEEAGGTHVAASPSPHFLWEASGHGGYRTVEAGGATHSVNFQTTRADVRVGPAPSLRALRCPTGALIMLLDGGGLS